MAKALRWNPTAFSARRRAVLRTGSSRPRIGEGSVIRSHTVIYAGNVIGRNFQTGNKVNIRESNRIGNNVSVGTLSVIEHHVEIGDGVRIHTQAFIPEYSVLEDGMLDWARTWC